MKWDSTNSDKCGAKMLDERKEEVLKSGQGVTDGTMKEDKRRGEK